MNLDKDREITYHLPWLLKRTTYSSGWFSGTISAEGLSPVAGPLEPASNGENLLFQIIIEEFIDLIFSFQLSP